MESVSKHLPILLDRAKSGSYVALPVKRVHIPKDTGSETRPIGIPATEDKLLQRAVAMLLEPIYEQDFLECSYGFRMGRSAHGALEALRNQGMGHKVRWIVEIDIRKFFDTMDHGHLRAFLRHRVRDGVITKLAGKWLKAGVLEGGSVHYPEEGTPQGGSISPLLSNIYLHYVLDLWFAAKVKRTLKGRSFLVRYADDAVLGFECKEDAERVMKLLPERFERFGLSLHPEKTRLIPFARPSGSGGIAPGTFDFLGFTHYWAKSRKGWWVIKRKTACSRLNRGLERVAAWCRRNLHRPVQEQHQALCQKLNGHFVYFGITGNGLWLNKYRQGVKKRWHTWLNRRSGNAAMSWERFNRLLLRYPLPPPVVVHSIYAAKP